jgi:hypothetical protein
VTWTSLLANKEAQKHKTSKKELDNMRALIARDLADAGIAGLSADRRFATAYNAALQAANLAIACAGYRIMSKVGHHRVSLESTKLWFFFVFVGQQAHNSGTCSSRFNSCHPDHFFDIACPCNNGLWIALSGTKRLGDDS